MKILISGANGFIGSRLSMRLQQEGHEIFSLIRSHQEVCRAEVAWDPIREEVDPGKMEGFDAVIHLAGESIAHGRWTKAKKKRILDSRVQGTTFLSETLSRLYKPPQVFIVASAIGYYGERGNEILTESSSRGHGFLPDVCEAWERSVQPVVQKGIRVVHVRIGVVLGQGAWLNPGLTSW